MRQSPMRRLALGIWFLALTGFAWAQAAPASMFGVVIAPAGTPVADAPIQARNDRGEQVGRTVTAADGRYTIASLPPGVYTISVAMPCCVIRSFTRRDVRVNAGQKLQLDIHPLLTLDAHCLPNTVPTPSGGATPFMVKLAQQSSLILVLFEGPPGFRQVFLDGRAHPADPNPTWLGHSIGTWDGDALIVAT